MSLDIHPWLALLLGVIIGVLFGWLLEAWFGRRQRRDCQDRLATVASELQATQTELQRARALAQAEPATAAAAATALPVEPSEGPREFADGSAPIAAAATPELVSSFAVAVGQPDAPGSEELRVACPQVLSRVHGVGAVYERKLYAAGIGSYWQLANMEKAELTRIFDAQDYQQVDIEAIRADALRLARETASLGRVWTGAATDDFKPLAGLGSVYEGRLYDAGICTYAALANATVEQLAEICRAPAWRTPDYASWIAEAQARLAG